MALIRLRDYIEPTELRNSDLLFDARDLKGLSINKVLINTKADTNDLNLSNYKIVRHNEFSFCTVTSRNGNKISLAYNDGDDCIISSINPTFKIKDENKLNPRFLMMFFNRSEFDRYARFNSWGSARETFTWEDMCDIELDLPPIEIQRKYVAIYEGLLANLRMYESKLEDLKLVCDGYIEDLRRRHPCKSLIKILDRSNRKNDDLNATYWGISHEGFIKPKQELSEGNILNKKLFLLGDFIFTPSGVNVYNKSIEFGVCSHVNEIYRCNDIDVLPEYLELWLKREEFSRYCDFFNISSVMANFNYETMSGYYIPVPSKKIQNSIVEVFNVYNERKEFVNRLKNIIKDICPLLVRGAIKEASEVK